MSHTQFVFHVTVRFCLFLYYKYSRKVITLFDPLVRDRSLFIGGGGRLGDFRGDLKFWPLKKGGPGVWRGPLKF